jgi:hypothetical protein
MLWCKCFIERGWEQEEGVEGLQLSSRQATEDVIGQPPRDLMSTALPPRKRDCGQLQLLT